VLSETPESNITWFSGIDADMVWNALSFIFIANFLTNDA
jgi:hypothetical protein